MIASEFAVTLISALVIALIILIKTVRRSFQSKRLNHDIDLLVTDGGNIKTEKDFDILKHKLKAGGIQKRTCTSFPFMVQIIIGMAVFVGFAWWTFYLFQGRSFELALISGVLALIGFIMPFVSWSGIKKRNIRLAQIDANLIKIQSHLTAEPQPKAQTVKAAAAKVIPQSIRVTEEEQIPQDSVLIRHYLANKAAELEALTHPYPTDSVLKRHYEAMVRNRLEESSKKPASTRPVIAPQDIPAVESAQKIPEDSVLKRHFLTQLRSEIEASLFPYPADSVLKRHYDALVESLMGDRVAHL